MSKCYVIVVPADFKKAVVTPLIKKSSLPPDDLKNYRPVSGLCFISKLVERVVASQLNDYVCSNGLENVKQSAYKLGYSTKTALLSIKNDVHLALARGEATAVVLLDQSAAFDTIDHGTLLGCLSSWFGVGGVVLEWFKSYLSDHLQCVKIGSILSGAKKLLCGVPQGSVLGPILFSLYTTPLNKVIRNHPGIDFTFMQMIHSYMFISHIRMCLMPLTGWKGALRMSKSGYLQISRSSTLIKPNSLFLVQKFTVKNSTNPFQLAISSLLSVRSGTSVYGLIVIFPS